MPECDHSARSVTADAPIHATLPDGTPVLLRRIGPGDRAAVLGAFARLSPESRQARFWTRYEKLPESILQRFLHGDPARQDVWAALDPAQPADLGHGGGSWWRDEGDGTLAEISFTVADDSQHRGVGTLLLAVLWLSARERGITRFVAHVLPENEAARTWFAALGAAPGHGLGHSLFTLPLDEAKLPDSPAAERLRAVLATLLSA